MSDCRPNADGTRPQLPIRLGAIGVDDWAAVRYVHGAAFERLASPYLEPNEIELFKARVASPEYVEDLMRENLSGAWVESELAGTAGWQPASDDGRTARITSIFVNPIFTGLGIGARLLLDAETRATQAGFTSFAVRSTPNAIGFFAVLGYEISSRGVSHVATGHDVPVAFMRKKQPPGLPDGR